MSNIARSFYTSAVATEHYLGIRWGRAVWGAVLEQAMRDIVTGPEEWETRKLSAWAAAELKDDLRAAAQHWVDDEANEPRRFVWVCEQLNLDPAAVREAIKRRQQ
jgi:hypothetical protein